MKSLNRMVDSILKDIRDVSAVRFSKLDCVRAINESIIPLTSRLLSARENFMVNLDNDGDPLIVDIPAGNAQGVSKIPLPGLCARLTEVKVKSGERWITLGEMRRGEWMAGMQTPTLRSVPATEMTYRVNGRYIELFPGVLATAAASAALAYEVAIPWLFMGTVQGGTANNIVLPSAEIEADGSVPGENLDDQYNRLQVAIYAGTGAGQEGTISDYVGATRTATFLANWGVALDATSKYAFKTPFTGMLADVDTLLEIRAAIVLLSTKRNEDTSGFVNRYNELEEAVMSKLETVTPGPTQIIPVGLADDMYYSY